MYTFQIIKNTDSLPLNWDDINHNVFLSKRYLKGLQQSVPSNIHLFFVGFYEEEKFVGKALFQCISIYKTRTLGNKESCLKRHLKNFTLKKLCGNVLFLGNNMLTGQHAFSFKDTVDEPAQYNFLEQAISKVKSELELMGMTIHLYSIKDFNKEKVARLQTKFKDYYIFDTQPNMIFDVKSHWHSFDDYVNDLSKKYRLQYNRAKNKMTAVEKSKLNADDIKLHEKKIYELYLQVVNNANFNTFILPEDHFFQMKKHLGEDLFFYAYFYEGQMVGFSTLIRNGETMDTYFLGYDAPFQKTHLLYLNMLYDMIAFSINQNFKKVIFGRTAMEIKSSIGAKPHEAFGLIKHKTQFVQKRIDKLFKYFDPQVSWIERHPFKP